MGTFEDSQQNNLLPTPRATDATHGGPNQRDSKGKPALAMAIQSISSPEASPASPSRPQESERERKMTASSGLRCFGLFERSNPVGSLARMLLGSLKWHSDKCVLSWKAWTTKSNVSLYQLAPSTRPIKGTGSGYVPIEPFLPTPNTMESLESKILESIVAHNQKARPGRSYLAMNLREQIAYGKRNLDGTPQTLLRTPSAQEPGVTTERLVTKEGQPAKIGERAYDKETGRLAQVGLTQQLQMLLKTPSATDAYSENLGKENQKFGDSGSLAQEMATGFIFKRTPQENALLPTPNASTGGPSDKETTNPRGRQSGNPLKTAIAMLPTQQGWWFPQDPEMVRRQVPTRRRNGMRWETSQEYWARVPMPTHEKGEGLLPTPQSSDNRDRGNPSNPAIQRRAAMGKQLNLSMVVNSDSQTGQETGAKLRLSPAFVEWMMGYPEGWLDFPMGPQSPKADGDRTHSKPMETP